MLAWILSFALASLFFYWIIFWRGAEWLEGSWLAELVFFRSIFASADGLRLIAWVAWFLEGAWFLIGLIDPTVRAF